MARFGFVGPSYSLSIVNADCQMTMNWYPELDESGDGNSQLIFVRRPGLKNFSSFGESPVRGMQWLPFVNRAFAVIGSKFCEVLADGQCVMRAELNDGANDGTPVTMVANASNQLLICSSRLLYLFDLTVGSLLPINASFRYTRVDFCDGYGLALIENSNKFQISALEDFSSWNDLDVAKVSEFTDNISALIFDHRQIMMFGNTNTIPYNNTGNNNFPFEPDPSAFIEQGIAAPWSVVRLDNTSFWIGQSEQGALIGWRMQGYTPIRITTHAIEFAWQKYADATDAIGYSYQFNGHSFWVIYFPSADRTWVYDVATQMWHEEGFWDANKLKFTAHRSRCHMYAFGKHLVGDWASGAIYEMSQDQLTDFGNIIRHVRRAPHVSREQQWTIHSQMQVLTNAGVTDGARLGAGEPTGAVNLPIQDPDGVFYYINILDTGLITSTAVALPPGSEVVTLQAPNGSLWQLGAESGSPHRLTTHSVTNEGQPISKVIQFLTPGRLQFFLQVANDGQLQTYGPIVPPDRAPIAVLRWSDDGGHSWSNEHQASTGAQGAFKARCLWRRLGRSRDRVYELTCADPVPWNIVDAYLTATPGFTPTERLPRQLQKSA